MCLSFSLIMLLCVRVYFCFKFLCFSSIYVFMCLSTSVYFRVYYLMSFCLFIKKKFLVKIVSKKIFFFFFTGSIQPIGCCPHPIRLGVLHKTNRTDGFPSEQLELSVNYFSNHSNRLDVRPIGWMSR